MRAISCIAVAVLSAAGLSTVVRGQGGIASASARFLVPATQVVAIRAGRLFDSRSGAILTNQTVLVRGDRIVDVGPAVTIPPDARVIDLGTATVLPGTVDAHVHVFPSATSAEVPHGKQADQFAYFIKWGMATADALKMAFLPTAAMLNYDWDDHIGSIEKGKFADIIAVAGNPLTDIGEMQRVRFVMKGGFVVRNDMPVRASTSAGR